MVKFELRFSFDSDVLDIYLEGYTYGSKKSNSIATNVSSTPLYISLVYSSCSIFPKIPRAAKKMFPLVGSAAMSVIPLKSDREAAKNIMALIMRY